MTTTLAPRPLLPLPSGKAWVVRHRNTLFGWHVPDERAAPGVTLCQVLAFRQPAQAMHFCGRLGRFKNCFDVWPDRTLADQVWLERACAPVGDVHEGLGIGEVTLAELIVRLSSYRLATAVVEDETAELVSGRVFKALALPIDVYRAILEELYNIS